MITGGEPDSREIYLTHRYTHDRESSPGVTLKPVKNAKNETTIVITNSKQLFIKFKFTLSSSLSGQRSTRAKAGLALYADFIRCSQNRKMYHR